MAVRNLSEIGENAQKIVKRLMSNQDLVKLLYYTDKDPLSHDDFTQEELKTKIYQKLIKIVPRIGPKEGAESIITINIVGGNQNENNEFKNIGINVEVLVPLTQWFIKDDNLRPFKIMGEVQKSLNGKTINGLGKMTGGDFALNYISDEVIDYIQYFTITSYD